MNLERIAKNAKKLSDPMVAECYMYECMDYCGFNSVVEEINEVYFALPDGIGVVDLLSLYCGNRKTKVYGKATCGATMGHLIIAEDQDNLIMFEDAADAVKAGYRPCARCMRKEYAEWRNKHSAQN